MKNMCWLNSMGIKNRATETNEKLLYSYAAVVVVQLLSRVLIFATPWTTACQASLFFTVSPSLLKFMPIESVMLSNHLILCRPFSSCPQSLPASGSFPTSQLFEIGGQSIGASASASILPMNIQGWFPLGLTCLISLLSRDSQESSSTQFGSVSSLVIPWRTEWLRTTIFLPGEFHE